MPVITMTHCEKCGGKLSSDAAHYCQSSASPAGYSVGQRLNVTRDIFDDGDDHRPPNYPARAGDVVVIRDMVGGWIYVAHEGVTNSSFRVYVDEVEAVERQTMARRGSAVAATGGSDMSALLCQFCKGSGLDDLFFGECEACGGTGFKEGINDWWRRNLSEYAKEGRRDANKGEFSPPHQITDDDPQYMDENQAYKEGFMERRKELGNKFKWA